MSIFLAFYVAVGIFNWLSAALQPVGGDKRKQNYGFATSQSVASGMNQNDTHHQTEMTRL